MTEPKTKSEAESSSGSGRAANIYSRSMGGVVHLQCPVMVSEEQAKMFASAGLTTGGKVSHEIMEHDYVALRKNPVNALFEELKADPQGFKANMELNVAKKNAQTVLDNLKGMLVQRSDGDSEKTLSIEGAVEEIQLQLEGLG